MKNELLELLELAKEAETLRPAVEEMAKALKSYGPNLYDLAETFIGGMVDLRATCIKRYVEKHGFTREEAILVTMDQWQDLFKNINKKRQ